MHLDPRDKENAGWKVIPTEILQSSAHSYIVSVNKFKARRDERIPLFSARKDFLENDQRLRPIYPLYIQEGADQAQNAGKEVS